MRIEGNHAMLFSGKRRTMETKDRTPSLPSTYVTLKQLQELRLKERQEEEERLRRQKEEEEEERLRRQKEEEEEERLRKFEDKVEERGRRWRRIEEEKAALRNPRVNPRSNAPSRRKWRRNRSGRPISGPSPNPKPDGAAATVGGSNRYPPASGRWREKQPAETDRTMKHERAYGAKNDGTATGTRAVSESEKINPEPSPEIPGGVNGRGRRGSRSKREFRQARDKGGGPERTVEIQRRFRDLRISGWDEKTAAVVERRPVAGRRGGGFGMTGGRGRWHTAAGGGMVWVRKTTSS